MSNSQRVEFTSPTGRLVGGDVSKGNTTDIQGNPLVVKTGANAGQPKTNYYIGVAIPKTSGVPWESEPWGQQIMQVARTTNAFDPATGQLIVGKTFAFKVTDGDSQSPNQNNKRPCDQEGYIGNWVLNFSNGFAPKVCNSDGSAYLPDPEAVKRGYFIQVLSTVGANNDMRNPGIFLNHEIVSLQFLGEEIFSGADMGSAGFGQQGVMPVGATVVPQGAMATPAIQTQVQPQVQTQQPALAPQTPPPPAPATDLAPPPAPATDLAPPPATIDLPQTVPEIKYQYNDQIYTKQALLAMDGWTEAHLANLVQV